MPAFVNSRFGESGMRLERRHDGVLLRLEKIEERLADLGTGHHLNLIGSLVVLQR